MTVATTLDPQAIERFRRDMIALIGAEPVPEHALGLAVSGGPDSMALLLLAAAAFPGAVRAATVDHGLRPEAAAEAAMVSATCAALGVPHQTLALSGIGDTGNLQQSAREGRYAALGEWATGHALCGIAVAHHLDDVAETLLLRARRGAGLGGLAEMARARGIAGPGTTPLLRPLLDWSRAELGAIVASTGIEPAQDPSNADPDFDRVRIRRLLAATPELAPDRLALAARNLRHAEDAIAWMVTRELPQRIEMSEDGTVTLDPGGLPYELVRRFAHLAVDRVRAHHGMSGKWRDSGLDRLIAALNRGEAGTIADVKAAPRGSKWRFSLAPARRSH